jgi:Mg2+ and Co2+ transporter CorA
VRTVELASQFGLHPSQIRSIVTGKSRSHLRTDRATAPSSEGQS